MPKRPDLDTGNNGISSKTSGAIAGISRAKRRSLILAGAIATITMGGALFGAMLKSSHQVEELQVRCKSIF